MLGPNLVSGFNARVSWVAGPATPPAPRFATQGHQVPVDASYAGRCLQGTAVCLGAPAPLAGDGATRLLLGGEIYNREAIAAAVGDPVLARGSDAELVLAAWRHWGVSAFRVLNGRFAAVVLDPEGRIVLATDHAGSFPLWVRADEYGLDVSSEAKTLTRATSLALDLPGAQLIPRSKGVHRVPAGTALILETVRGEVRASSEVRTWAPPLFRVAADPGTAVARVRELLGEAVRTRLRGEPEPTVVLSGGIDSSGVAAHAVAHCDVVHSVSMGTDASDEFEAAAAVAGHLGTVHTEITVDSGDLLRELPWAVWAAEITDHTILEYLLPLIALYRRLPPGPRRVLTGYGADIPLGGMHRRADHLDSLDGVIAHDMATFDGLNEMSPVVSGLAGIWSTHPYWDRDLLDQLVALDAGLKRRHGRDKWVLRESLAGMLPEATLVRPKLGIHEGSGTTSSWTAELLGRGVLKERIEEFKAAMARRMYELIVLGGEQPESVSFDEVLRSTDAALRQKGGR